MIAGVVVHVVAIVAAAIVPAGPWAEVERRDGQLLEAQPVVGSDFENLRTSAVFDVPPDVLMTIIWGDAAHGNAAPNATRRDVLVDEARRRVIYEVVENPLVSKRDYVIEVVRDGDRALRFAAVTDARRPPQADVVRVTIIAGSTVVEPVADRPGACRVVHTVLSDPGGSVPAWLATGPRRKAAFAWIQELRRRVARAAAQKTPAAPATPDLATPTTP